MRQTITALLRPFYRVLLRTVPLDDPWVRFPHPVPLRVYGAGARRDFAWYLEGESSVPVRSVEEIQAWLLGCTYARDPELFNEPDFWQHPRTFEQLRRGDCEDFALWTWRKLLELGHEAELVVGRSQHSGCPRTGHAWVLLRRSGAWYLFDAVARDLHRMLCPLEDVRHHYHPEASVDGRLARYAYVGYLQRLRGSRASERQASERVELAEP